MNNFYIKFSFLFFFICVLGGSLLGQIAMPTSGTSSKTVVGGELFYDSNQNGNYSNDEKGTITFKCTDGNAIRVTFSSFEVQGNGKNCNQDVLTAYDGSSDSSTEIGSYCGYNPPSPITSSGNSLTFSFTSSKNSTNLGWKATIEVLDESEAFCIPSIDKFTQGDNVYISNVLMGDINNSSSSNKYTDYTASFSTDVEVGTDYLLTVTNGITYKNEGVCNVWIDWNKDGDFEDSDEIITTSATFEKDKEHYYSAIISPSSEAVQGKIRMRIRISKSGATVCENTTWGEVEDYTLNVVSSGLTVDVAKAFAETCNGNDGVIQFYETTPAIDSGLGFSIDGGSTWQTSPVFTGLSVGNYNLRIRNTGGGTNSADYSLSIGSSSALTISTDVISNENCNVTSDGAIDVSVSGGRTGCMQTDGSTGMIDLQSHFLTGLSAFTMEGWVKLNDARSTYTGQQSFFGQNDVIEFGFENNYFCCWTAKAEKSRTGISNYPDDQEWHHVAVVGTGTNLSLYIDGEVVYSYNESSTHTTYGTNENYTVKIGAGVWNSANDGNPFNGVFADVRFWSDARTTTEIQDNMSVNLNGDEAGLIAVYKMDTDPVDGKTYGIGPKATVGIVNSGASWIEKDPIYFYSWTGPDSFVSTEEDLTALSAGTYNLTVSDLNACTVSKSFDVEVEDTEAPVPDLGTLPDVTAQCEVKSLTEPTASDNCGGTVTVTNNATLPISGEGPTVVTWTYTDDSGNSSTQDQNVVIKDVTAPAFQNLPTNIAINASGDFCGEVVNYTMPSAIDNCTAYTGTLAGFTYLGTLDNHTYYHSDKNATASDAMLAAASVGGHLVTITSQAENDFINNLVGSTWIGINDTASEGTFVWSNGEAVSYTNWSNGEPNDYNIGEDYAEMNSSGKWNDLPDTYPRTYVIEFEGALVTQTEGLPSGSLFPVGITTNTFEATDNAGNTSSSSFTVTVADVTPPKILPLRADYYDGINLDTTFKETLPVDELNYYWGSAPESALVGSDDFSIRFQGSVQAVDAGIYTFYTTSDDGVRLLSNGDTIINNWSLHGSTVNTGTVTLSAGQTFPFILEYYEHTGGAVIKLQWKGPGLSKQYVKSLSSGSCQDVTVDVSTTGSYDLTVDEVDPGYSDECGIASRKLSRNHFTCTDLGSNPVTLTITDMHGNSTECSFNVIVVGNVDASISLSSATGTDNQLLCINTDITNITYAVTDETGVTVSGLPAGVRGKYDSGTFTISGKPTQAGAFLYSVIASGVCESDTITGTIIVSAMPEDLVISEDMTVCAGNTTTISVDSTNFTDYSMHFDGVDDYLGGGRSHELNFEAQSYLERTVMLWFKPEDITSRQVIYKEGNPSNGFVIYIKSDTIYAYGITSSETWSVAKAVLTAPDQWYHFAFTWNHASQLCKAYLNGNFVDTLTEDKIFGKNQTGNSIAGGSNVRFPDIDFVYENKAPIKFHFKGNIDNFKLWTSELIQDQIIAELSTEDVLYTGSPVVFNYDFNDYNNRSSSTSVTDVGGSAPAAVISGAVYESSIVWDDPKNSTTFSINVNPTKTTTYTATVSNDAGCDRSVDVELTVNPIPKPIGIFFDN